MQTEDQAIREDLAFQATLIAIDMPPWCEWMMIPMEDMDDELAIATYLYEEFMLG